MNEIKDFLTENGSSQGQHLALTGRCVPSWFDSGIQRNLHDDWQYRTFFSFPEASDRQDGTHALGIDTVWVLHLCWGGGQSSLIRAPPANVFLPPTLMQRPHSRFLDAY